MGEEGHGVVDAFGGGEGLVEGCGMEGKGGGGSDGDVGIDGVVRNGDEVGDVGEDVDQGISGGEGAGGKVDDACGEGLGDPGLEFGVEAEGAGGGVVGVHEGGHEEADGDEDDGGVGSEGEGFERGPPGAVEEAAGGEVVDEIVGLESAGPGVVLRGYVVGGDGGVPGV